MTANRSTLLARPPAQLAATVRELLGQHLGHPVRVRRVERAASPFASQVPAELVMVSLDDGTTYPLFLKSFGDEDSDHPDKQCRDRELRVYRHVFAGRHLPVPRCLGGGWNESIGRHDLYLDYVHDWDLRYQSLAHWYLAASHLGGLQRAFARERVELFRHTFLQRLDVAYFHAWADRAMESVRRRSGVQARRYAPVLDAADRWGKLLADQPATLVHNDLSAKNVLVDRSSRRPRVCIVDWELAGIGCGLLDLVHLSYGLDPGAAGRLRAGYLRAVGGSDLLPPGGLLPAVLAACTIHETNVRLWLSRRWLLPEGRVAEWVSDAVTALRRAV